ncbi:MAG: EpsD family peptidyl-prolyl cis-trans isomerase [Sphingobium sp.]
MIIGAGILPCTLAACSPSAPPDQVAVTGDDFEITLAELEQVLQQAPPAATKEQVAPARRAILTNLIDQKLLAEAALETGLDKDTATLQAIQAERRAILARAYIHKIIGDQPPGENELRAYYDSHPALFARRKNIVIRGFTIPASDKRVNEFQKQLDAQGFDALAGALSESKDIPGPTTLILPSNAIPEDRASALAKLTPGSDVNFQMGANRYLGTIVSVENDPVSFDAARPEIARLVAIEKGDPVIKANVAQMRKDRHIKIVNKDLMRGIQ